MRLSVLLACLLLASCKGGSPVIASRPTSRPVAPLSAASPAATTRPVPSVASLDSVALSGHIALDAGYIVAQGAGNIVSQGAGNIVSQGAGNIVSQGAGNIVSQGAGNIVSQGAGNIVSQGAGNVIAAKLDLAALGNQLIGNDGASAVAAVTSALISNDGGSIISNDGASLRLLEAAQADGVLPVAGMAVQAINLATSRPILMVDGKGRVGKWVLSDAQGNYKLYVPRALENNVAIVAQPPARLADARLRLARVVKPGDQAELAVDEATTLALDFCLFTLQSRLDSLIQANDRAAIKDDNLGASELAILESLRSQVNDALDAGGVRSFSDQERRQLSRLLADYVLSQLALKEVVIDKATVPAYSGPVEPALDAIEAVLRKLQAGAAARLARDPGYFASQPPFKRYNDYTPTIGRKPFEIKTPADVGAFIGEAYVGGNDYIARYTDDGDTSKAVAAVLRAADDTEADQDALRLDAGINGMSRAVIYKLGEKLQQVEDLITSMKDPTIRATLANVDTNGR